MLDQAAIDTDVDDVLIGILKLARLDDNGTNCDGGKASSAATDCCCHRLESLGIFEGRRVDVESVLKLLAKSRQLGGVVSGGDRHDGTVEAPLPVQARLSSNVGGRRPIVCAGVGVLEEC